MEAIILTKDQYQDLVNRMESIQNSIKQNQKNPKEELLDNSEMMRRLHIRIV